MAKILSKTGISSGSIVQAWNVTQSIDAFTGVEAYDITLSGSLVVTGSVSLNTNINKDFFGTASNAPTSSFSTTNLYSSHSLITSFADNETSIYQLYSYQSILTSGSQNFIGVGNYSTSSADSIGLVYPYNGTLISATVTSNVTSDTGSLRSDIIIFVNTSSFTFSNKLNYTTGSQFLREAINLPISQEDKIYAIASTGNGTEPGRVIHNINLYIKRNG
jgi:hypothetical protein